MITEGLADRLREYYTGKICTIITSAESIPMDKKELHQWFTIMIDDIDSEAIVGTDIRTQTKSVFFFPIIGIIEEQLMKPDHPKYEVVKQQVDKIIEKEQKQITQEMVATTPAAPTSSNHISIDKIQQQAAELKQKWSTSAN